MVTDVPAECHYNDFIKTGLTFETMTGRMISSGSAKPVHTANLTGLRDGGSNTDDFDNYVYVIMCQDSDGITNKDYHNVPFSVATTELSSVYVESKGSQSKTVVAPLADTATPIPGDTSDPVEEGEAAKGSGIGPYFISLEDLAIGTRYYVRAYGVVNGIVYYGNQVTFETKDVCFIATAAYGSIAHPHVATLRTFRDMYLKSFGIGRIFIDTYYHYSPALAGVVEQHPVLRSAVQVLLLPLIGVSYILVNFANLWIVFLACLLGIFLAFGAWQLKLRVQKEAF